jgi:hypothetical protein
MLNPESWPELTRIEPAFLALEHKILAGTITDYRQIHPEAFAWHGWDQLPEARLFAMLLPFLRQQVHRARSAMPTLYGSQLAGVDPQALRSPADWQHVPLLVKDDDRERGLVGFRSVANQEPFILRPADMSASAVAFGSGGSLGRYTPTFVSLADREREIQGWRRGHRYHGLVEGDSVLYSYNIAHKGGQWMQESLLAHGVNVYLRRPEEGPRQVLENLRAYGVNALFIVQPPYEAMQDQEKAAGLNLHALVLASLEDPRYQGLLLPDENGCKQIEFIFLGGFEIVPYALELAERYLDCIPMATLLGSSEAIPQACSTNPALTPGAACHYNNLHLLPGPHYTELVKPAGSAWAPVEKGEEGLLAYTSWARDGTVWIRYAPGDVAMKLLDEGECACGIYTPVITNVHRQDAGQRAELLLHGCAAG